MAAITLVTMFVYSATLASVVLVSALLYALLRAVAYRPLREASMERMILGAQEQSCFLETIRAVQAIKLASTNQHIGPVRVRPRTRLRAGFLPCAAWRIPRFGDPGITVMYAMGGFGGVGGSLA